MSTEFACVTRRNIAINRYEDRRDQSLRRRKSCNRITTSILYSSYCLPIPFDLSILFFILSSRLAPFCYERTMANCEDLGTFYAERKAISTSDSSQYFLAISDCTSIPQCRQFLCLSSKFSNLFTFPIPSAVSTPSHKATPPNGIYIHPFLTPSAPSPPLIFQSSTPTMRLLVLVLVLPLLFPLTIHAFSPLLTSPERPPKPNLISQPKPTTSPSAAPTPIEHYGLHRCFRRR